SPLTPEQIDTRVFSDEHRRLVAEGIDPSPDFTSDARATAQPSEDRPALADEPKILDRLRAEVRRRGLVGEDRKAAGVYLVLTSRMLDRPVSAGVKGHSSSGKSYVVETLLRFFPASAFVEYTAMSQCALVYSREEFKHRTIVVYELTALREGVDDDLTSY